MRKNLKKLFSYYKPYMGIFIADMIFAFGAAAAVSYTHLQTSATPVQPQFNGIQRPQKPTPTVAPRDIKIPEFLKNTKR